MLFIFKMSPIIGPIVFALISAASTATIFVIVHILFRGKRTKFTRIFAQQMALRIGTMHALVVAFVYSALTMQLIDLYQMSNTEAISAANVYWALEDNQAPEAVQLRKLIPDYLQAVIEKDWKALHRSPQTLPAWELIKRMREIVAEWRPSASADRIIRNHVFNNINTMAENRDRRIIERAAPNLPLVFWFIAILGYLLSLVPYLTVEHSKLRLTLVCCYAVIIGVLFYGIAVLDNPFQGQVILPTAFEVKLQEIVAGQ